MVEQPTYPTVCFLEENIFMCDSKGLIASEREDLSDVKKEWAQPGPRLNLAESLVGKDVFLGLSVGGLLKGEMIKAMNARPIIFAMANPDPEITPDEAKAAVPDAIVATGRSDFPNQVNNRLLKSLRSLPLSWSNPRALASRNTRRTIFDRSEMSSM